MSQILTVGDVTIDRILEVEEQEASLNCSLKSHACEICFKYGEKIPIKSSFVSFGGGALNCALGFKRLGLDVAIATFVGEDREGADLINFLQSKHIKVFCQRAGQTNHSTVVVYKNERTVLSYHSPRNYQNLSLPVADWIYLASAGKGSDVLKEKIIAEVNRGSKLVFNPGNWELQNFDNFIPLLKYCAVLILNRSEANLVMPDLKEPKLQLEKMQNYGVKIAVITDAQNGAYFGVRGRVFHINSLAVDVKDPTGAGDAFASGFIGGIILGATLEESAKWGMVNATSVIENIGANSGLLTKDEIVNLLKKIAIFRIVAL